MFLYFLLGFLYFAIKAYRVKENLWLNGFILGALVLFLSIFLKILYLFIIFDQKDIVFRMTFEFISLIFVFISIIIIDHWSGLYWDIDKHNKMRQKDKDRENELTPEELEKIGSLKITHSEKNNPITDTNLDSIEEDVLQSG